MLIRIGRACLLAAVVGVAYGLWASGPVLDPTVGGPWLGLALVGAAAIGCSAALMGESAFAVSLAALLGILSGHVGAIISMSSLPLGLLSALELTVMDLRYLQVAIWAVVMVAWLLTSSLVHGGAEPENG